MLGFLPQRRERSAIQRHWGAEASTYFVVVAYAVDSVLPMCHLSVERRIMVHGDDFFAVGDQDAVNVLDDEKRRCYELKIPRRFSMDHSKNKSQIIFLQSTFVHHSFRESSEF